MRLYVAGFQSPGADLEVRVFSHASNAIVWAEEMLESAVENPGDLTIFESPDCEIHWDLWSGSDGDGNIGAWVKWTVLDLELKPIL